MLALRLDETRTVRWRFERLQPERAGERDASAGPSLQPELL